MTMMLALRTSRLSTLLARRALSTSNARSAEMAFTFAAPNGILYHEANVKQVDVPSFSGSFGILPAHVPSLAVLKPGVVSVYEGDGSAPKKFFVSSGSVSINEDSSVQILAEEAHPLDALDADAARKALSEAQNELANAGSDEASKAEAQIAVEVAEEIVKAVA